MLTINYSQTTCYPFALNRTKVAVENYLLDKSHHIYNFWLFKKLLYNDQKKAVN